jgi:hypothetical protein
MLTNAQLLEPLAARRADHVVVTTMSAVRPWGRISNHDLDFASADSAMGHAADLALGIAIAQPSRRVVCLNGDGSMLMSLGTLVTVVDAGATNLVLIVVNNGEYELTGGQRVPGAGSARFVEMARAAGFPRVHEFRDAASYERALDEILSEPGPTFVEVHVEPGREGPISRGPSEEARYLQRSIYDSARSVRRALGTMAALVLSLLPGCAPSPAALQVETLRVALVGQALVEHDPQGGAPRGEALLERLARLSVELGTELRIEDGALVRPTKAP